MVNRDSEKLGSKNTTDCERCQHSVPVRGMNDIVCLAYLSVRTHVAADSCAEFEVKRAVVRNAAR